VYDEDRLVKGRSRRTKAGSKSADEEYERRNETRLEYQRLSRYYPLEGGRTEWNASRLLSRGEHGSDRSIWRHFTYPCCHLVLEDLETISRNQ